MTKITEALIRKYVKRASEASNNIREPLDDEYVLRFGHLLLSWLADSLASLASMRSLGGVPDPRIASLCRDVLPEHTDLTQEDDQVVDRVCCLVGLPEDGMLRQIHWEILGAMRGLIDQALTYPPMGLTMERLAGLYKLGLLLEVMADVEDLRRSEES